MAVDLRQLGKLLALTRSGEPQEALRAEEVFTSLFFKWCDEQGLPAHVGFVRIGDTTDLGLAFLEVISTPTGARVLQLNAFDLCAVGSLPECQALAWWFENVLPEVVETSHKSAYGDREAFQLGACRGIHDELRTRSPFPGVKPVRPAAGVSKAAVEEPTGAPAVAPPTEPVKLPSVKEQTAIQAGLLFGRKLVQRSLNRCPYPLVPPSPRK